MENVMHAAFKDLIADPAYGGRYVSLTPGHPCKISDAEYQELVKAHIMFKDMADDPYLASAGIASDWPHGRGCYISEDKGFLVWVGEEVRRPCPPSPLSFFQARLLWMLTRNVRAAGPPAHHVHVQGHHAQ